MKRQPSGSPVRPWHILAGLGAIGRSEICSFLANFREASLLKLAKDRCSDLSGLGADRASATSTYERRLTQSANDLDNIAVDDATLRVMLWAELREALHCRPSLPLSIRSAGFQTADIATKTAAALTGGNSEKVENAQETRWTDKAWSSALKLASSVGVGDKPTFGDVVSAQADKMIAEAIKGDAIDADAKSEILDRFRRRLADLPPELRSEATERAIRSGDANMIKLLVGGGGLIGTGIAVEAAGFGAYMLAAQASAILPLLGGKAAVSLLFVLSNPLFIVSALAGGGWFAKRHVESSIKERLAAGLVTLLALRGLAAGKDALYSCLNDFRSGLPLPTRYGLRDYRMTIADVRRTMGGHLPPLAATPPGALEKTVRGAPRTDMERLLFPDGTADAAEVAAIGALTAGDILYAAALIDPQVVLAADFARAEDLSDLFRFGAFAERASDLAGLAAMGAESNLKGYVAEQIVMAKLIEKGHQVSLPDASNNPGFDLLIDGQEMQVKCLSDVDGLAEHFTKYPDTAVIANAELASDVAASGAPWAVQVYFLDGYDLDTTVHLLRESLAAGAEIVDLDVPYFAVAVSAAKQVHGWWTGQASLADLPFEIAVDGVLKGSLAIAGGLSGQALGLLIFGPAGAVVFGGGGGVLALFGAGPARQALHKGLYPEWFDRLSQASLQFIKALTRAIAAKTKQLDTKLNSLGRVERDDIAWVRARMLDDKIFLAEAAVAAEKLTEISAPLDQAEAALRTAYDFAVHPRSIDAEMHALMLVLNDRPKGVDHIKVMWTRLGSSAGRGSAD